jgi:hypothetical protein
MKNKITWIFGSIFGLYALSYVLAGYYGVIHYGNYYELLNKPIFFLVSISFYVIAVPFYFSGLIPGDGSGPIDRFWIEGVILPILIITIWTLFGMVIGWLIQKRQEK